MPLIKSAIKRVRQSEKRRQRNLIAQRKYKALMKDFEALVANGKIAEAKKLFPEVQKAIDLAAKKNILQKNTAGRRKSRLSKLIADKDTVKAPAKKTVEKKEEKK